uniref:Ras association domain family member 3 n=2 Tax=Ornithorhynchus anatinus TaxID=9258 RepID=A0A6I8PEC1_ORNAN
MEGGRGDVGACGVVWCGVGRCGAHGGGRSRAGRACPSPLSARRPQSGVPGRSWRRCRCRSPSRSRSPVPVPVPRGAARREAGSMSSGYSSLEEDAEDFFFTARTSLFRRPGPAKPRLPPTDVERERETHNYLSQEEIKEKVQNYNLAVTDKLKMTLNSNGIYTGFIKVQLDLCRPVTVCSPQSPLSPGTPALNTDGSMNTLHISSTNTVREVIEALLRKFLVADHPTKFALYKRCHREDQVYACKLSDREHPLYLRLVAGPRTDTLSFVLREHETGEWEAFSLPELQNFLRILDKEEDEQLQGVKRRYAAYRHKLEEALSEVWKPG